MFVTSFGPEGYDLYGKRFLETYTEHMGLPIVVYVEGDPPPFQHELVTYRNLFDVPGCVPFLELTQIDAMKGRLWGGKRNYRFDIHRFCRKSFAQIDAAGEQKTGKMYWIDADVEFHGNLCPYLPKFKHDCFMLVLDRPEWHSCASFVGFNLDHELAPTFFEAYWKIYLTGTVFAISKDSDPGWTDCHVLDWLRKELKVPASNLADGLVLEGPANVFDEVFGKWAHHKKGNLKHKQNRYQELLALVEERKPKRILEIGTWNGGRAVELCQWGAEYVGFDLFEEATDETDTVEKNVKKHFSLAQVSDYLHSKGLKFELNRGNTRETLPKYDGEPFDFAFIDGGHSIETIRSDWAEVQRLMKPGGLVVFDDYYEGIDTTEVGCNALVEGMTLGQCLDPVAGGGGVRIAWTEV